jgi:hypothetical protein
MLLTLRTNEYLSSADKVYDHTFFKVIETLEGMPDAEQEEERRRVRIMNED